MTTPDPSATHVRPSNTVYLVLNGLVLSFIGLLVAITTMEPVPLTRREALLTPVFVLVGLTALVFLLMLLWRNVAVFQGRASVQYYRDYASDVPDERIERPTRIFNNLMQVPVLFYVLCILMLVLGLADAVQLSLAWVFVATRVVHAGIYLATNYVPMRLWAWLCGCLTLGVMWVRFASMVAAT